MRSERNASSASASSATASSDRAVPFTSMREQEQTAHGYEARLERVRPIGACFERGCGQVQRRNVELWQVYALNHNVVHGWVLDEPGGH